MKLPPLDGNESKIKKEVEYSSLPNLDSLDINEDKDKFQEYFRELIIETADQVEYGEDQVDNEESRELKQTHDNLMDMFKGKEDSNVLLARYEREIKKLGLYNIDSLSKAIETGEFDITNYDTFTMSLLLQKLENIEPPASLESFNIETVGEFYALVSDGKIEIGKYNDETLDGFLDKLIKG